MISGVKIGELLAKQLRLEKQLEAKDAQLKIAREALEDVRDNWDCEYVEGSRYVGHHPCRHCNATEALKRIDNADTK